LPGNDLKGEYPGNDLKGKSPGNDKEGKRGNDRKKPTMTKEEQASMTTA